MGRRRRLKAWTGTAPILFPVSPSTYLLIVLIVIDGRYALYAQLNGIALYAFLKLNLALLKSKPVIFRN